MLRELHLDEWLDHRNPDRTVKRFKRAMHKLREDGQIGAWAYTPELRAALDRLPARHWLDEWLQRAVVEVEIPVVAQEQYARLATRARAVEERAQALLARHRPPSPAGDGAPGAGGDSAPRGGRVSSPGGEQEEAASPHRFGALRLVPSHDREAGRPRGRRGAPAPTGGRATLVAPPGRLAAPSRSPTGCRRSRSGTGAGRAPSTPRGLRNSPRLHLVSSSLRPTQVAEADQRAGQVQGGRNGGRVPVVADGQATPSGAGPASARGTPEGDAPPTGPAGALRPPAHAPSRTRKEAEGETLPPALADVRAAPVVSSDPPEESQ